MLYTDASNAQERMGEFLARCEQHDIPVAFYQAFSSREFAAIDAH